MVFKFVGREHVDYISKKNNERVEGVKLHVIGVKDANSRVEGCAVEALWISKRADSLYNDACQLALDTNLECSFNRWGSLDSFRVMK